jgi:hypothetical protein
MSYVRCADPRVVREPLANSRGPFGPVEDKALHNPSWQLSVRCGNNPGRQQGLCSEPRQFQCIGDRPTETNTVITTIPVGSYPVGVAITPDSSKVYVTNEYGNSVSVIDTASNRVAAARALVRELAAAQRAECASDDVGFMVLFGKHILTESFTASDPNQTLRSPKGLPLALPVRDSRAQPECLELRSGSCATSPL